MFQVVPPPAPDHWSDVIAWHRFSHDTNEARKGPNWVAKLGPVIQSWSAMLQSNSFVPSDVPYDPTTLSAYLLWYVHNGKTSTMVRNRILAGLSEPLPRPVDVASMSLPPRREVPSRQV
jgi:hypothetical protein